MTRESRPGSAPWSGRHRRAVAPGFFAKTVSLSPLLLNSVGISTMRDTPLMNQNSHQPADRAVIVQTSGPVPTAASRPRSGRRLMTALLCSTLLISASGCNYFILLGYLIGGPPQLEPQFEKETGKSFTDKDIRVAVVCYAPDELKYQYSDIDHVLASRVCFQMQNREIDVIPPDRVRLWLEENTEWDSPVEVGAAFDVSYVVYVDISEFTLYEHDSNATLFRGRCEAIVSVYEMKTDGDGRRIFSRDITSVFPIHVPRSAAEVSYENFRLEYFMRLSDEIGRLFYPYLNGDDIGFAT